MGHQRGYRPVPSVGGRSDTAGDARFTPAGMRWHHIISPKEMGGKLDASKAIIGENWAHAVR